MPALRTINLVDLWEQGRDRGISEWACLLLRRAHPEMSAGEIEALPLGARDDLLLQFREQLLGHNIESTMECPGCGETLQIDLDTRELLGDVATDAPGPTTWQRGTLHVRFRVPTCGDLRDLESCRERDEARRRLIERCVLEARRGAKAIEPASLTREESHALAERVALADPRGELILDGCCPHCGRAWKSLLDVASFFWGELETYVKRLLVEVHALARAYCWRERDILAMSAWRRQVYLELLGR